MSLEFFHGTSSIFMGSIKKHGFGGLNPNIHFNFLKTLRYLVQLCDNYLDENSGYDEKLRSVSHAMALQTELVFTNSNTGCQTTFNFEHKHMYVSLSYLRAVVYAITNTYGSEILERCIILYNLLLKYGYEDLINNAPFDLQSFKRFIEMKRIPIIIKFKISDFSYLQKENGDEALYELTEYTNRLPSMTAQERFEIPQFLNYRLLKIIPSSELNFYSIDYCNKPGEPEFEFTLSEIK
jgi:hypothetical protein